jgi:hypothetical protein
MISITDTTGANTNPICTYRSLYLGKKEAPSAAASTLSSTAKTAKRSEGKNNNRVGRRCREKFDKSPTRAT